MNLKTIAIILFSLLGIIWIFKECSHWTEPTEVKASVIDSLNQAHDEAIMQRDVQLTALQWEIRDLNMARRWDSVMLWKQDAALKESNKSMKLSNVKLKQANDAYIELRTLNNCDTLSAYAAIQTQLVDSQTVIIDSLQELIPVYQQTIDDLVVVYDQALNAANDKALEQSKFYSLMRTEGKRLEAENTKLVASIKRQKKKQPTLIAIAAGVVVASLIIK